MDILIVVDMQNDFISGSLGTNEAQAIVNNVVNKVKNFNGKIIFTRDTHEDDYMDTQEGRKLPVTHCVIGTDGWQIHEKLQPYAREVIDKPTFGSVTLAHLISAMDNVDSITLVGICTDICVISNAMLLKAYLPEVPIFVDASCCAGVTPESHKTALEAMKACQINIVNE